MSVSYTHLDVYKRQYPCGSFFIWLSAISLFPRVEVLGSKSALSTRSFNSHFSYLRPVASTTTSFGLDFLPPWTKTPKGWAVTSVGSTVLKSLFSAWTTGLVFVHNPEQSMLILVLPGEVLTGSVWTMMSQESVPFIHDLGRCPIRYGSANLPGH